jgi:hypothetical protein
MDNKKFEQLIDLVINENEEQARALFHDIVVEKSREIYENMMADDMQEGDGMGGQVGQMMDEISAEEQGMTEEDEEVVDFDDEDDEDIVDIDTDDDMGGEDGTEERLVSIEDKLDQLMAEFESIMGDNDSEMGDDDGMDDMGDDMGDDADMGNDADMGGDPAMMEAITLKKVSVTHGDNGQNTKSTSLQNSGQAGMDSRPVKFSGASETVPTSPKGPSNFYSKGETSVKDANNWKNAPAQNNADLEAAPKPKAGDNGSNSKSVIESRKPVKRKL